MAQPGFMMPGASTPPCKCCGSSTTLTGSVDYNRSCLDRLGVRVFPPSEVLLPYWSCRNCSFVFTDHMDSWSAEDFTREIYNADYIKVDPPIPGRDNVPVRERPSYDTGKNIAAFLQGSQNAIRIMDFGSGADPGPTGQALIDHGFNVHSYDPYRGDIDCRIAGQYEVIIAIEVFEHCHDLAALIEFMKAHLAKGGILWIQTMLHPHPTPPNVLSSWYISPRNGHISIFSLLALNLLFRRIGINIVQTPFATIGFQRLPQFPNRIFVGG
jgi:Methyltransferase domain